MATLILAPNGPGDETAIPNLVGAATHWQAVLTNDGDTSYVEVPDVDDTWYRDLYAIENSSNSGEIANVTLYAVGRIGQPLLGFPSGIIFLSLKTHGIIYEVQKSLPSYDYGSVSNVWTVNPNTGEAWTWDEINALQAGMYLRRSHLFSPPAPRWSRVTQVYVVVTYTPAPTVTPTVTTDPATSVESASATLNGTLEYDGGEACDVRFQYGETSDYGIDTEWQSGKESVVAFEQAITGLSPNKTYHFRAQARNSAGTMNGDDRTFTTLIEPTVTTNPATSVEKTTANLNGTLDDDGNEACDCGFEWGETTDYGTTTPTDSKETGETFSQDISGLVPGKHYHFRAIATNSAGTSYGSDRGFFAKGGVKGNPYINQRIYQHAERMGR